MGANVKDDTVPCPHCSEPMPKGFTECPACGASIESTPTGTDSGPASGAAAEIGERLQHLERWRATAAALGVELGPVPRWVEGRLRRSTDPGWIALLDEAEAEARARSLEALQGWEKKTLGRLQRLESYSIDGRLEREQVDDAVASARSGEAARALGEVQQVDRVIALKERHLDVARQELERLIELVRDLRTLGLPSSYAPKELAEELEEELRGGRFAPLKQQLRALRLDMVRALKTSFPDYVARYGEFLLTQRSGGSDVRAEVSELARTAKAYSEGRPDEAVHRLRLLAEIRPLPGPGSPAAVRPDEGPTGPSRTA